MSNGFEVFRNGGLSYSTLDSTYFAVDVFTVPANTSIVKTYNLPNGTILVTQLSMLNSPSASVEDYTPVISIIDNTVSVNVNPSGNTAEVLLTVLAKV